jgi:hypothetical protein
MSHWRETDSVLLLLNEDIKGSTKELKKKIIIIIYNYNKSKDIRLSLDSFQEDKREEKFKKHPNI